MEYYNNAVEENGQIDNFQVSEIFLRTENNFLQGLYLDDKLQIFESAGLYGQSHIQKLKVKYGNFHAHFANPGVPVPEVFESRRRLHTVPGDTVILEPDIVTPLKDVDFGEGLSPRSATEFVVLTWQERRIYTVRRSDL